MYFYCALVGCPIVAYLGFFIFKEYRKFDPVDVCFVTTMCIGIILCIVFLLSQYPMI